MSTEVKVALIAAAAVFVQVVVSYLINRQRANDLRANIDREVDIIRKLEPGSPEALRLESHVKASIDKLITRDERREQIGDLLRSAAPLPVLCFTISGLGAWRERGVPEPIEFAVDIFFWALVGVLAAQVLAAVWRAGLVVFGFTEIWVKGFLAKTRTRRRLREGRRTIDGQQKQVDKVMDIFSPHEDEIIQKAGQGKWDELTSAVDGMRGTFAQAHEEFDRIERNLKSIKPAREFLRNHFGQRRPSQQEGAS
ncbi:hypothetical protein BH11ACT6_BH11ACT6_05180 [soil metagenome]